MQYSHSYLSVSPTLLTIPNSTARRVRSHAMLLSLLLVTCALCSGMDAATVTPTTTPAITINPTVGPPTSTVFVSGSGFDPYANVDVYFDASDLALATTNGAGVFGGVSVRSGIAVPVPASAIPGTHWITAVERFGHKMARKSFLVRTDWAQFHFEPSHTGLNPYENVLSPDTVGGLTLRWSYPASNFSLSPTVANGVVYEASDYLYALNASSGALLWQYPTSGGVGSTPAVANGVVYFGDAIGNLYALNASSGALLWQYTAGDTITSSPAVANGVVYFGSYNYNVYALNATTGALLWRYQTDDYGYVTSSPAVTNGVVYIGSDNGSLYAMNASTGVRLWVYRTYSLFSSPAVANGVVYIENYDGNLYALNASSGALLWQYPTAEGLGSTPAVANGVVYFGSYDNLCAVNANTRALLWQFTTGLFPASPAVANGVVYVVSLNENAYALNATTGALLWQSVIGGHSHSSPAVVDGVVYVGAGENGIYAFGLPGSQLSKSLSPPERPDPALLRPDWKLQPSTPVTQTPSTSQKRVE